MRLTNTVNSFISTYFFFQVDQALFEERFFGGRDGTYGGSEKNYSAYVLIYERVDFLEEMAASTHPADLLMGQTSKAAEAPSATTVAAAAATTAAAATVATANDTARPGLLPPLGLTASPIAEVEEMTPTPPLSAASTGPIAVATGPSGLGTMDGRRLASSRGSDSSTSSMAALAARMNELAVAEPHKRGGDGVLPDVMPPSISTAVALSNTQFNFACHLFGDDFAAFVCRLGNVGVEACQAEEAELARLPNGVGEGAAGDAASNPAPCSAAATVADLLARLYFRLYLHLQAKPRATDVRNTLLKILRLSQPARTRVCQFLSDSPRIMRAAVLKAKTEDLRQQAADVILCALVGTSSLSVTSAWPSQHQQHTTTPAAEQQRRANEAAQQELLQQLTLALQEDGIEHVGRSGNLTSLLSSYVATSADARRIAVAAGVDAQLLRFLQMEAPEGGRRWSQSQLLGFQQVHRALAQLVRASDVRPWVQAAEWHTDAPTAEDAQNRAELEVQTALAAHNGVRNPFALDEYGLGNATASDGRPVLSPPLADAVFGHRSWTRDLLTHLVTMELGHVVIQFLAWNNPSFSFSAITTLLGELDRTSNHDVCVMSRLLQLVRITDTLQLRRVKVREEREVRRTIRYF